MNKRLGKQPVRHDSRTFRLERYLDRAQLPPAPAEFAWDQRTKSWGLMLNDSLGDCTIAAAGHLIEEWTADSYGGTGHVVSDAQIVKAYSDVTGYNPKTGANDNGAVELDVLNYWRKTGIGSHKIWSYMAVNPLNHDHVRLAAYLFGGLYIGLSLPVSAQAPGLWDVPKGGATGNGAPGSWGGHAVPAVRYDAKGLTVVTWGALQSMTWKFWDTYVEEAYAVLGGSDWIKGLTPVAPNGFLLAQLQADLADVSN